MHRYPRSPRSPPWSLPQFLPQRLACAGPPVPPPAVGSTGTSSVPAVPEKPRQGERAAGGPGADRGVGLGRKRLLHGARLRLGRPSVERQHRPVQGEQRAADQRESSDDAQHRRPPGASAERWPSPGPWDPYRRVDAGAEALFCAGSGHRKPVKLSASRAFGRRRESWRVCARSYGPSTSAAARGRPRRPPRGPGPPRWAMPSTRIALSPRLSFSRPSVEPTSRPVSSRTRSRR